MTLVESSVAEELLKARKKHRDAAKTSSDPNYEIGCMNGLAEALDIVEKHSNWIPVNSERLPHIGEDVYITYYDISIDSKGVTIARLKRHKSMPSEKYWDSYEMDTRDVIVLAWQPLPALYEGE